MMLTDLSGDTWKKLPREKLISFIESTLAAHKEEIKKQRKGQFDLYNASSELVLITDETGRIRFANEAFRYKLGYAEKDLMDNQIDEFIQYDYKASLLEKIRQVGQTEQSQKCSGILINSSGKFIYVNGSVSKGGLSQQNDVLLIMYDVSERVRAESFQNLFYAIASLTSHSFDPNELQKKIYQELNKQLKVQNYSFLAVHDDRPEFQFYVNEHPQKSKWMDIMLGQYCIDRVKPLIIYEDGIKKIAEQQNQKLPSQIPIIWLGVPIIKYDVKYVISICSYDKQNTYNHKDLELLDFISSQLGLIINSKHNQEIISSQDARIRAIFDSSAHQIWSISRKYSFTSFNQNYSESFFHYFDKRPEIGMNILNIYSEYLGNERAELWKKKYDQAFAGENVNFETSIYSNTGELIWRNIFLHPISLPDGRIEEVSIIANDITEKKQSEAAIIRSEEKFRNIFESFQDVYFRCDLEGIITMVSPSSFEILGLKPDEMLGLPIEGFFINENNLRNLLKILLIESTVRNFEATVQTKDGRVINFLCNIRLIRKDGYVTEIEGVARDVTDLKKTNQELKKAKEIAERSLKIKERFLANMSHEIRTPMNGIVGMIDLLATTSLDTDQEEYVKVIRKSSDNLLNILNDILDLSKIEAGKMTFRNEVVNMLDLCEKVYDLYSKQAQNQQLNFFYHLDPKLPEYILTDETRLMQIIGNLISNAIKFSQKKGDISLSIALANKEKKNNLIKVQVKDSGIGISPKDQEKLFHSFTQIDSSNRKQFAGTGLGLAISKELVKSMNGDIGVASTPGLGSTFWFTFQAEKGTEASYIKESKIPVIKKFEQSPKVLLVDDNEINRKVAVGILQKAGCQVSMAHSGEDAINQVQSQLFDIIFMDIQMPDMDGIEAMKRIRSKLTIHCPPIIAMTAYTMEEDREKFIQQGMDDYLAKPIKSQVLIDKVYKWTKFEPQIVEENTHIAPGDALIINQNTLNQLRKYGGMELISDVLSEFAQEAKLLYEEAMKSFTNNEIEITKRALHTLKGNAGTFGIEKVNKQAARMEKNLKENKFEQVDRQFKILKKRINEFEINYKKLITNHTLHE